MNFSWSASAADRRLLPEGRLAGPMPWVIAIMMFLTALATAAGIALGGAAAELGKGLGDRLTIQIVEANPDVRDAEARAATRVLARLAAVREARRVSDREIAGLMAPWFGEGGLGADVPVPAMIDVDLAPGGPERSAAVRSALAAVAPAARIDDDGQWLAPLASLLRTLLALALGIVAMMVAATAAAVVLAARAALNTNRATIDTLHLLGATDLQVARLFQRRIALDALFGGGIGLAAGMIVILLLGARFAAVGAALLGVIRLPGGAWPLIALLPFAAMALATLTARLTVLAALRRMP